VVNKRPINSEEMSYLLHLVTLATRRTFVEDEGSLWLHLLSDYTYDECHDAMTHFLKTEDAFLTPQRLASTIRARRRERLAEADMPKPPNGVSGQEYIEWLHGQIQIASAPPEAPQPQTLESNSGEEPKQLPE